jgi:hypothetical protein
MIVCFKNGLPIAEQLHDPPPLTGIPIIGEF